MKMSTRMLSFILSLLALIFVSNVSALTIVGSKHDLSSTGGGGIAGIRATTETRICVFCHTPHNGTNDAPLWNRSVGSAVPYIPYSSSTMHSSSSGGPTGSTILCLSCHDGTIAIGNVIVGGPITMANGVTTMPVRSKGYIGTNLSDDHPVSFQYLSGVGVELLDPTALPRSVRLDSNNEIQCATCHDAHDNTYGQFLVMDNIGSNLCETCHLKTLWDTSPHNTAPNTWNGVPPNPWPNGNPNYLTVADNACGNCHAAHTALVPERLFTQATEELVCFVCHNANVATSNIQAEFLLLSHHPVELAVGLHQPGERPLTSPLRHVECVDCHNAHEASVSPIQTVGISGVSWDGVPVDMIVELDQLCFKCHSNRAPNNRRLIPRDSLQDNVALEFDLSGPAFHPLRGPAKIGSQSLLPPWIPAPLIAGVTPGPGAIANIFPRSCFECHLSRPHGTNTAALLSLNMVIRDGTPNSPLTYQLCYSCHNINIILGDTTFTEHSRHILNELTSCVTCHTPHGSSIRGVIPATTANHLRLINFNLLEVTPLGGVLRWTGLGNNMGTCTLICHGESHNNEAYP